MGSWHNSNCINFYPKKYPGIFFNFFRVLKCSSHEIFTCHVAWSRSLLVGYELQTNFHFRKILKKFFSVSVITAIKKNNINALCHVFRNHCMAEIGKWYLDFGITSRHFKKPQNCTDVLFGGKIC